MNQTHPNIDQIVDYLHGELSAAEDAAVHAHLASCPECDRVRADEVALTDTLRAHARARERELPLGLVARIREATTARPAPASLWDSLRAAMRPAYLLPAAAAIAVVVYFGFARHPAPVSTAIDPSYYVQNHAVMAANQPFAEDAAPMVLTSSDETH